MRKLALLVSLFILLGTTFSSPAQAQTFTDVPTSHQFYEHINYLNSDKIISGVDANHYDPNEFVTRKQAALMVARAMKLDMTKQKTVFSDVSMQNQASGAIQSANDAGIIKGYPDGTFRPQEVVTRGQMTSFIARAFKLEKEALPFADVSLNSSAYSSIRKATAFGVVAGYSKDEFKPNQPVTRAHFAAFLARALNDNLRLPVYACGYNPESKTNPDRQTINCLLTEAARNAETTIPPEIVKAVASVESNGWVHFQSNGEPMISSDGGIGLMQITNTAGYDVERLKYDLTYNIETGIDMLVKNFNRSDLPKIADHNPENLESWYFAVMAYNGTKAENSPFFQATGKRNLDAYQEKVFQAIRENGLLSTNITSIDMTKNDFTYGEDTNHSIIFNKKNFTLSSNATPSKELLSEGNQVKYDGKGIRKLPSTTNSELIPTSKGTTMKIIGSPIYDQRKDSTNHFVWYPVETIINGKNVSGYISSSNIVQ